MTREDWSKIVEENRKWYEGKPVFNELERSFARHLSVIIEPNDKILEIGCGHGKWFEIVPTFKYTGLDWCPEMISIAQKKYPEAKFILADMHDFKPKEKYDLIFEVQSLNYFDLTPQEFVEKYKSFAKKVITYEPGEIYEN